MPSERIQFPNQHNEMLSGRLEMPEGEAKAFALFAHCFTCTKDIAAASRISRKLTKSQIAVLRFDFTGLGNSDGDFSNTNFSSNRQDLLSACRFLSDKYKTPELLIGHSLGGAACLSVASELQDIKAVVTIGAPSDVKHISHLFSTEMEQIEKEGEAEVLLAGRRFRIKKQFIEDINEMSLLDKVGKLQAAVALFHSPQDETVSIDHAKNIYLAAKHPKSFISLDKADHLLTSKEDAEYVASVLAAWCERYL